MKHFPGGGCLKGENHVGACEWGVAREPDPPKVESGNRVAAAPESNAQQHGNDGKTPQQRWKARNREKMRARHREYMREWRKRQK